MKNILVVAILLFSMHLNAQTFQLGIKAGLTNTQIIGADFKNFEIPSSTNGILIGAFSRIGFAGMFVQPEICFRNLNFTVNSSGTPNAASSTTMLNYIDVPVMFGKKILKFINVSAGPNFQFLVNKDLTASNNNTLEKGNYNDFVLGAQLGVGVEIWKLCFDARYDFSINPIGNVATVVNNSQNVDFSSRASMFQFTIGYKFIDF
jgi:hypothetical protein